jgi:hypothetical protein
MRPLLEYAPMSLLEVLDAATRAGSSGDAGLADYSPSEYRALVGLLATRSLTNQVLFAYTLASDRAGRERRSGLFFLLRTVFDEQQELTYDGLRTRYRRMLSRYYTAEKEERRKGQIAPSRG